MKKVLFIGDVHGKPDWSDFFYDAFKDFREIVFLGDYVDSFYINAHEQIKNLKNIINLKKEHSDKITLLLGNHDYAYIFNHFNTSGYQHTFSNDIKKLYSDNWDLFDVAWGYESDSNNSRYTLATHAGL
ncbi:MAG: metallophosphoesterase, partial [bacterium]